MSINLNFRMIRNYNPVGEITSSKMVLEFCVWSFDKIEIERVLQHAGITDYTLERHTAWCLVNIPLDSIASPLVTMLKALYDLQGG